MKEVENMYTDPPFYNKGNMTTNTLTQEQIQHMHDYENELELSFNAKLQIVLSEIGELLLEKNRKYGNSALEPCRIFSKLDAAQGLRVRIDDKLSRMMSDQIDETEDTELDLIGYLLILRIAKRFG